MKKLILVLLALSIATVANAQEKYISRTGHIWFYSKTPVEVIEAHNNQVATVINTTKGTIAFDLLIKSFKFERALMEEHFNENYMESGKYPKCTFSGKFVNFDVSSFRKNGSYKVTIEGDMTMHGITKHISNPGTIEVKDGKILARSKFNIKPEDYNIQIPGLVRDKIASNMETTVDIMYEPYK